ncbi:glycosyltransferase [Dactylosporangium fulvum]
MAGSYGFLSTHPPTQCGLATFNSALAAHLTSDDSPGGVVRVDVGGDDAGQGMRPGASVPPVVHTWSTPGIAGWQAAAAALDRFDTVIVQHEYGIYPGPDGGDVVPLLRRLRAPSIVVLHTVLAHPSAGQKRVLEQLVAAAGAVVTMTGTARDRLLVGYAVDAAKVSVIPHGAADHAGTLAEPRPRPRPHLLTWGLLGPGKGIEWALRAVARLRDLRPAVTYTVAGRTHPKVRERHGEAYRTRLQRLGTLLGISEVVDYLPVYHDEAALGRLIRSADVVVLPYDSSEQVTSGVLTEAVAAGVPVVATPFPHAVELLTNGPGLLVPHRDPAALAAGIEPGLTDPGGLALSGHARPPTLLWPAVAARYETLAERLRSAGSPVAATAARA